MARQLVHEGTKSWWSGTVRTLCGLVLEQPQKKWFATAATCPACKAKRGGRK